MNNYKFQAGDVVRWQSKYLAKVLADQVGNEVACTRAGEDEHGLAFAVDLKILTFATPPARIATLQETIAKWPEHLCGRWAKEQLGKAEERAKMRTHNLKTWPSVFQAVWDGAKTAEFRRNDRDFAVGDNLLLKEFEPGQITEGRYTGREILASVTHTAHGGQFDIPVNFCMMSIKVLRKDE